jgi:hypothetical protein
MRRGHQGLPVSLKPDALNVSAGITGSPARRPGISSGLWKRAKSL